MSGVRDGYDRWAPVYDHDGNPLPALEEPHVRRALGDVRGCRVLDLGCGTGRHTAWLAGAGAHVTAADFSEKMLERARRKVRRTDVRFVVHDLHEPLPFGDASFDGVVSGLVLEHLRDLDGFFREARRVLTLRGRAVVSAMHPAMFLRESRARFTDPQTGEVVAPGSVPHGLGDFVMATVRAGLALTDVGEYAPNAVFVRQYPRAASYEGWPMLVVLAMEASTRPTRTATPSPAATPAGSARPGSKGSRNAAPSGC